MSKRIRMLALLMALLAASALAAGDRKVSVEDTLAIRAVAAPLWSPDGKWIAFTVSDWNKKEDRRDSHIHIVSAAGGRIIKLTNGERGETAPQWSPDGSRLAFLANRDAQAQGATPRGNQVWAISAQGGEAERITDEESGVSQFRWSPDGKAIAYVVGDTAKDKAERDKRKKEKFDAIVVDADFTYSHVWSIDPESKTKKRITEGPFTVSDPQWSPDSRWIAFVLSRAGKQDSSYTDISEDRNTDIFVVSAAGGATRQLTSGRGPETSPRWSPDGRLIAFLSFADPASWAAKTDLMIVSQEGGAPRNLTSNYPESVSGSIAWTPDGKAILAGGAVGVYGQVLKIPATGGNPMTVFEKPAGFGFFDLSPDGAKIAYTFEDENIAEDIWVATSAGKEPKQLTRLNPQVGDFRLGDTDVIKWKGADGLEIEGILIKPVGYERGKRYPMILQIHGGPYGRFAYGFEARAQIFASNGYAVLMPNPRGSTGYGNRFTTSNLKDWGGKDYQDLMLGVDEMIKLGIADQDRLAVMGGSYGGFMTFWVVTQTDRFKAAIGHAGISDWYSFHGQSDVPGLMEYGFGGFPWVARETYAKYSPMSFVERVKTPLMITHGEQDRRVPIAQAEQYYRALRKRGVEVAFVRYPREGHGITEPNHIIDLVGRQLTWFDRHVKGEKSQAASGNK
ncbi:MAG TPA: S9 family peptidase [Blastocatellia bacterium]|nr:S9 family peptidase [Blastocatellia bacterium]